MDQEFSPIKIDNNLWVIDSYFTTMGCKGSIRMTVIKGPDGLTLYSPIHMSYNQIQWLRSMGPVSRIIAPNLYHHLYLRECIKQFPESKIFIPKNLEQKIGIIEKSNVLIYDNELTLCPEVKYFAVSGHILQEILLFHEPTQTVITADMTYHYQNEQYRAEKIFFGMLGCYGKPSIPFYHFFSVRNSESIRKLIATVQKWQPRRIVMSHGRIINDVHAGEIFASLWSRFAR